MATPDELRKQLDAITQVRVTRIEREQADIRRDEADRNFRAAIIAAMDAGAKAKDIAVAAGISRQRVHQVYREG